MIILGGMGNIWGVAVGAFVVYMIQSSPEAAQPLLRHQLGHPRSVRTIDFLEYQFLLYGIALVVMMLLRPEGLFPTAGGGASCTRGGTEPGAGEMTASANEPRRAGRERRAPETSSRRGHRSASAAWSR